MEVDYRKRGGELRQRTYDFALRIVHLWKSLPKGIEYEVIGKQLLRCGTSIGANYRAATVGKSDRDFFEQDTNLSGRSRRKLLLAVAPRGFRNGAGKETRSYTG